jgi:thiol-disulfide isomerase/thioredoxin
VARVVQARCRWADCFDIAIDGEDRHRRGIPQAAGEYRRCREGLGDWVKNHDGIIKSAGQEAAKWDELLGRPARDWQLVDLVGKPHALKDYRGKVVVLDFWYRTCVWCVRAMPQVIQIARHFEGKPVAVLGMNTDEDPADARYVVDKLGIPYPILRSNHEVAGGYGAGTFGFPILVIIDRAGRVRDIHIGYSDTLGEDVIKPIDALLDQ